MGEQEPQREKDHICIALLAHVDAGKTTLSENILYHTGVISKMGRVDKKDAYLDTDEMEKQRGITIFSKQAEFSLKDRQVSLLDTPGHVDFSPEAERVLSILDYAVLLVSASDGVQAHTETLWNLLERYRIPTFLFVNKMDQSQADKEWLMRNIKEKLSADCEEYGTTEFYETVASGEEELMEAYLGGEVLKDEQITDMIRQRKVFPCLFGSALKDFGVEELLEVLYRYALPPVYGKEFGARVFKITRDENGVRQTHMKITSGCLKIKDVIEGKTREEREYWSDKVNQIRICSGMRQTEVTEVGPGAVCTIPGLLHTYPGQGLGIEEDGMESCLTPLMTYAVHYPKVIDQQKMLKLLKEMEEEEPQLHVLWDEQLREIQIQLMGEVQIEILKAEISRRYEIPVEFGTGKILYRETIESTEEGVGHFEPLRHYAEVHLILEPGERGSGLIFQTRCPEDELSRNWQNLILTHLRERRHLGVLGGFPITDMVITLVAGRAHPKHTEGGDFRQATYRAVRQGLMKARSRLLEPVYDFKLTVPTGAVGRAMTDLTAMSGKFDAPVVEGDFSIITGVAPVATINGYQKELVAYTAGQGKLECRMGGYLPAHNEEEVLAALTYDAPGDMRQPSSSVFCTHGAGFVVEWYEVEQYMHLPLVIQGKDKAQLQEYEMMLEAKKVAAEAKRREEEQKKLGILPAEGKAAEKELKEIFEKTYGVIPTKFNQDYIEETRSRGTWNGKKKEKPIRTVPKEKPESYDYGKQQRHQNKPAAPKERYLLVDGYNIIYAWDELKQLAENNIEGARNRLMEILCNFQGYTRQQVILVYDAYKVQGHQTEVTKYRNISVVYTKEAETADQYIERCAHRMGKDYEVTVATSDGLEQVIIVGAGCHLISAREFEKEVGRIGGVIREHLETQNSRSVTTSLGDLLSDKDS
ncbi:MAG: NYN domain-containing protein [Lachnospiraceae bacterium]